MIYILAFVVVALSVILTTIYVVRSRRLRCGHCNVLLGNVPPVVGIDRHYCSNKCSEEDRTFWAVQTYQEEDTQ